MKSPEKRGGTSTLEQLQTRKAELETMIEGIETQINNNNRPEVTELSRKKVRELTNKKRTTEEDRELEIEGEFLSQIEAETKAFEASKKEHQKELKVIIAEIKKRTENTKTAEKVGKKSDLPGLEQKTAELQLKKGTMVGFDRATKNKPLIEEALDIKSLAADTNEDLEVKLTSLNIYINFAEALADSINESRADTTTKKNLNWLREQIVVLNSNKKQIEISLKYNDPEKIKEGFQKIATSFDTFSRLVEATVDQFGTNENHKITPDEVLVLVQDFTHYNEVFSIRNAKKTLNDLDTTKSFFANLNKFLYLPLLRLKKISPKDSIPEELRVLINGFIDLCEKKGFVKRPEDTPDSTPTPASTSTPTPTPTPKPKNFEVSIEKGGNLYEDIKSNRYLIDVAALVEHEVDIPDDALTNAVNQLETIMKAIPADKDTKATDFDSVKKEIIDPIKPIFEYLSKIQKDKQKPKQKSLLATLIRFAKRVGVTLEKNKTPEPKPTPKKDGPLTAEEFEQEMADVNKSPIARKITTSLQRIIKKISMGASIEDEDTDPIKTQIKRLPDDATKESKIALASAVTTDLKECAGKITPKEKKLHGALSDLALALNIDIEFKKDAPAPRDIVPKTAEQFVDDVKNPDTSRFILKIQSQLRTIKAGLQVDTIPDSTVKELKANIDAIPDDATEDSLKALKATLEAVIQACVSLVKETTPKSVKELLLLLGARLELDVTFTKKDPTPTSATEPEVRYIPASEAEIVLDTNGKELFNRTPGFKSWIDTCVAIAKKTYSTTELPGNMRKTLQEWHDLYVKHAEKLQKLQTLLLNNTSIDNIITKMFAVGSTPENIKTLKQKALDRVFYDIFSESGSFEHMIDKLIESIERSDEAKKEVEALEQKLQKEQERLNLVSDLSKEIPETDFNRAFQNKNSSEFNGLLDQVKDFVVEMNEDYSDLAGSLSEDESGGMTTFYLRLKHRRERKKAGATGKMTRMGKLRNRAVSALASVSFKEESGEINKLNAKIAILRRYRLIPEKGAGVTKGDAAANMDKLIRYIEAVNTGKLGFFPTDDKEAAEPAYNELFKEFVKDNYSYSDSKHRDAARASLQREAQKDVFNVGGKKVTAETSYTNVAGEVWNRGPFTAFQTEIEEDLFAIDLKKISSVLKPGLKINSGPELTALTQDYPRLMSRRPRTTTTGTEHDMETLSINVLQIVTSYLGEGRLITPADLTIKSLDTAIRCSVQACCETNDMKKTVKVSKLTDLKSVLVEYDTHFTTIGDTSSSHRTQSLIAHIEKLLASL